MVNVDNQKIKKIKIETKDLCVYYNDLRALNRVNIQIREKEVLTITGPSGSGKTTFLRTLNRLNDLIRFATVEGDVIIDGESIFQGSEDLSNLRKKIGMIFALPIPLPMSIFDNVAYGPRVAGIRNQKKLKEIVDRSLIDSGLWEEVKDRLNMPAGRLSGGQQQRLCIARILAVEPEVILFDEPCSGLDPISTLKIENLVGRLKQKYTIVFVTHNVQQAGRIGDRTAFFMMGELVEIDDTDKIFTVPKDKRTEDYIRGRFG